MKGFQVVSLDIEPPDTILPNIHHYECDISCLKDVQEAHKHIKEKIGKVTVLINNAALVGPGSILDLNEDTVERVVNVNLVSHFWTVKTFLPDMIEMKRGHIVTIGSIIGYFGPAKSSLYCCSKAGLLTFHDSLTHELKNTGVKTLLVTPGQLNSRLFEKVSTPNKFIAPILSTAELAMRITQAVSEGQCGQIFDPIYTRLIPFTVAVLPQAVSDFFRSYLKVDDAMDGFEIMRQSSDLKRINKN